MTMGERIAFLRKQKKMTQEELGAIIGVQKSAIRKYEKGSVENIKRSSIEKMAKTFGVSPAYLMGFEDSEHFPSNNVFDFDNIIPIETKKFPLLGEIACGEPIVANEEFELYIEAGASIKADFCLRARGDSMIGARIYDGDIVFIRKQEVVENGEIAAVIIDDEATLKRIHFDRESQELLLFAENPNYKTMRFIGEELDHIHILGKAVAFQSDIK